MAISQQHPEHRYVYKRASHATERDMIKHLLDDFRCTEEFGAEYVPLWLATSDQQWYVEACASSRSGKRFMREC